MPGMDMIETGQDVRDPGRSLCETWRDARSLPPGAFVLLLVVAKCPDEPAQNLRRGLEHRLELGLVDLLDVLAQVRDGLFETALHLLCVVARIAVVWTRHVGLRRSGCRINGPSVSSVPTGR